MSMVTAQSAPKTSSLIQGTGIADEDSGDSGFNPMKALERIRQKNREPETVKYLESLFERAKTARWRFESQWVVNLSYYFGKQWITWINGTSPDIARLYEPQAPPWRVRLVVNRIRPAIRREMSKVMKEKPTAYVIPSTTDDSDVAAAKAGEAIFEHQWRTLKMKKHMWIAQFWRACTGTGFIKDWWDPSAHAEIGQGNVCVDVPTPFHLYFSNLEQDDIERQDYLIHVAMKSPSDVKALYGVDVHPDTVEKSGGVIDSRFWKALNLEPGEVKQIAVKEIWIKPNSRYPRGAMFVWANSKLLWSSVDEMTGEYRWPLYKLEYPFTDFKGVPTGRFYGDSSIVDLLPLQKEYNRTRSQIIEAKNQASKPQLLAPAGSINANKITSEPGLVIFYTPGYEKPTPLQLTGLPNYVLQELDRTLMDMADLSGQHEVSSGTVPQGVTAASALSFLQEQDDTMIAPIIESLEYGVERLGRHILCHVRDNWDLPRAVKVFGPDNTWEIKEFKGDDLKGNVDFNIQAGSAMPRSVAAKQAFIMELIKMQVITPERGLRYLEMAETGQMYEEMMIDRRQAERENMRMSDPSILVPDFSGMWLNLQSQLGGQTELGSGMDGAVPGFEGQGPMQPEMPMSPAAPPMGDMGMESPALSPQTSPSGHIMNAGPPSANPEDALTGGGMGGGVPGMEGMEGMMPSPAQAGLPLPPPPPVVPVNTWDNHEVHIQVHNDYRKRQEFENLDPRLKEEFERHVEMHRSAIGLPPSVNPETARQMMTMQQLTPQLALPGGAPPESGMMEEGAPPEGELSAGQGAPL